MATGSEFPAQQGSSKRTGMLFGVWAIAVALLVLAGVSVYDTWFDAEDTPATSAAATRTLGGELMVRGLCGQGGLDDGDLVQVTDHGGNLLGVARLSGQDTRVEEETPSATISVASLWCEYRFQVVGLAEVPLYNLDIGDWRWQFALDELEQGHWSVRLSPPAQ